MGRRGLARLQSRGAALGLLTGLNVLNYVDRYVGAAVLPLILSGLALSDAEGGLLQSAFILTYSLICPLAGWLGDRRPRLPLAAIGVVLWSGATVASGLASTYALLLCARALTGLGEGGYAVVTPSLISDYYPPERRGRALAIFFAAIPAGSSRRCRSMGMANTRVTALEIRDAMTTVARLTCPSIQTTANVTVYATWTLVLRRLKRPSSRRP